jgi:two-component system, cell cycle response regulator
MVQKKLRILLAETEPSETVDTLRALFPDAAGGLDLIVVSTMATLVPTAKIVDPEIILLDLELSMRDPLDAVHLVHRSAPGIPLVVLADPSQKQFAAQSLSEGAMDYVLKGFMDARTLGRVLRTALERNTFEGLADLLRDPMTGLYTREGLQTLGSRCMEEARRTGESMVLICALFENLHTLRDGFGPGAADHALRDVATLLAGSCRRSDLVARLGPAQFAVLAVDAIAPSAPVMLQRLEKHIAVHNETRSPWGPIDLRLAVGAWSARDGRSFAELVDEIESQLRHIAPHVAPHTATQTPSKRDAESTAAAIHDTTTVRG